MYDTSNFRNGLKIEFEGMPYIIVEFQHVKPGKGGAFVRTRLKNLLTGQVIDHTFRSGEKVGKPDIEVKRMQYLYNDGESYVFMDTTTYDQISLSAELLGKDVTDFLKENEEIEALFYKSKPVNVELPFFVELEVVTTDPGVRGDTASGGSKPATLETGGVVNVPLFINEGDIIKIDTRSRAYLERMNK